MKLYTICVSFCQEIHSALKIEKHCLAAWLCIVDGELKIDFLPAPIFDAFEPPDHKNHFNFTLGYPWNVQIHFFQI